MAHHFTGIRRVCSLVVAGAMSLVLTSRVHAIGRAPQGNFGLPADVAGATVRVTGSHVEGPANDPERVTQRGSGVVINIKRDATGNGGFICVLTADHVAGQQLNTPVGQNWRTPQWQIGFGNGTLGGGPWITLTDPAMVFRPPAAGNGNRIDLTLLGAHVDDVRTLTSVPLFQGVANVPLAQAGYGDDVLANAALVNGARNYTIPGPNDQGQRYGTYRDGINQVDAIENTPAVPIGVDTYLDSALRSHLAFLPAGGALPITFGASYILTGDSGGPAFERNTGIANSPWQLVGIHSISQTQDATGKMDGYSVVLENSIQYDVNVGQYLNFINNSCAAVPEPMATLVAVIGGLMLMGRRRCHRENGEESMSAALARVARC